MISRNFYLFFVKIEARSEIQKLNRSMVSFHDFTVYLLTKFKITAFLEG